MRTIQITRATSLGLIGLFVLWFELNKERIDSENTFQFFSLSLSMDSLYLLLEISFLLGLVILMTYPLQGWLRWRKENKQSHD